VGNANVGVAVMVGDSSIVGVNVTVGVKVDLRVVVSVNVAVGVSVNSSVAVAVAAGAVEVASSAFEGAQAETNKKFNKMILYIFVFSPEKPSATCFAMSLYRKADKNATMFVPSASLL
jgi:hypothetical protein